MITDGMWPASMPWDSTPSVMLISIHRIIDPTTAGYLEDEMARSVRDGSGLIVIQIAIIMIASMASSIRIAVMGCTPQVTRFHGPYTFGLRDGSLCANKN
jgi:hypothetical protein